MQFTAATEGDRCGVHRLNSGVAVPDADSMLLRTRHSKDHPNLGVLNIEEMLSNNSHYRVTNAT